MLRRSLAFPDRLRRARSLVALAAALASGCLVSFDGYQARETESDGGEPGTSGKPFGGSGAGPEAGAAAGDGAASPMAGEGGQPEGGGDSGAGMTSGAGTPAAGNGDTSGSGGAGAGGTGGTSGGKGGGGGAAGGGGGTAGSGGTAGTGGEGPKTCPVNLEGPPMIEVPKSGGGFYCMDRTEIPAEDYAAFLAAKPSTANQAPACTWNSSFEPDVTSACTSTAGAYNPSVRPRSPVSCVDWCDAKRYCEWAGKRLCGAIGGGSNPVSKFADAEASQWYRACSKAGTQKYPYGDTYQSTYCVGLDNSGVHPSSVANAVACEGGYPGLFDMSGNVAEWEDSCNGNAGANDSCLIRGGNLLQAERTAATLLCNSSKPDAASPTPTLDKRSARNELIGFRCCLDP